MPRRDGTGPLGMGAMTGWGLGWCRGFVPQRWGPQYGMGCRWGFGPGSGRAAAWGAVPPETRRERLLEQKQRLQAWLKLIDEELSDGGEKEQPGQE